MLTGRVETGGQNRGGYASVLTMGVTPPGPVPITCELDGTFYIYFYSSLHLEGNIYMSNSQPYITITIMCVMVHQQALFQRMIGGGGGMELKLCLPPQILGVLSSLT